MHDSEREPLVTKLFLNHMVQITENLLNVDNITPYITGLVARVSNDFIPNLACFEVMCTFHDKCLFHTLKFGIELSSMGFNIHSLLEIKMVSS
jgi:hypothetical protein